MKSGEIYRKSAKGLDEIQNRTNRLAPRLRQVLIMVNGQKALGVLAAEASALGDIAQYLSELEAQGLVEKISDDPMPRSNAPAAPLLPGGNPRTQAEPAPSGADPADFDALRSYLAKSLLDHLGSFASEKLDNLRRCKHMWQLQGQIEECAKAIESAAGKEKASQFLAGLAPGLRPQR
jgi:hypothetical protein